MKQELTYCEIKKKQDKKYNDDKIYLYNEYSGGSSIMPIRNKPNEEKPQWFKDFEKKDDKRWAEQDKRWVEQDKRWAEQDKRWEKQESFNKQVFEFMQRQDEFNKTIVQKIDAVALDLKETKARNNLR